MNKMNLQKLLYCVVITIMQGEIQTNTLQHTTCLYNLTKVRSLFTPSHRGSGNSPLLIMFSANYID